LLVVYRDGVTLTPRGNTEAELVWRKLSDKDKEVLRKVASFLGLMNEDESLLYMYTVYGYSEKSNVITRLLRRRKELALSMLKKGLVSVELAAKITGMPLQEFISYIKKKGIKQYIAEANDVEEAEKL